MELTLRLGPSSDSWNSRLGFPAVKRIQKYSLKMACFSALKKVIEFSTWGILRHFILIRPQIGFPAERHLCSGFCKKRNPVWRKLKAYIYYCYVIGLIFIGQENSVFQCQVLSFNFFPNQLQSLTHHSTVFCWSDNDSVNKCI